MLIASKVVGIDKIYIYLRDEYPAVKTIMEQEIKKIEKNFSNIPEIELINMNKEAVVAITFGFSAFIKKRIGLKKIPPPIPTIPETRPMIAPTIRLKKELIFFMTKLLFFCMFLKFARMFSKNLFVMCDKN